MNEARRKIIQQAAAKLVDAQILLSQARDEEQEAYDNLPEVVQGAGKREIMGGNVDLLPEVLDALSEQEDRLNEIE